jgi:hypothetical protein
MRREKNLYQGITPALVGIALRSCHVTPFVCDYVTGLLSFWSQSGLQGLPVGCNASRIFAEAVLIPIDEGLDAEGIDYIRFVDDFYLFTDSFESAQKALETLREVLAVSKFALNPEKTRIFPVPQQADAVGLQKPSRQSIGGQDQMSIYGEGETASGYDSVQKHFRPATGQEIARMCAIGDLPDPSIFLDGTLAPQWYVRQSLRRALYLNHVDLIKAIPKLVAQYPELSHYILSGLSVCSAQIHQDIRADLAMRLGAALLNQKTPSFVCLNIIVLLKTADYCQRHALKGICAGQICQSEGGLLPGCLGRSSSNWRNTGRHLSGLFEGR